MKKLIIAVIAVAGLGGCIAVADPYYPAPAVGVGFYSAPVYRHHSYHHHHRHHGHGHHRGHWR